MDLHVETVATQGSADVPADLSADLSADVVHLHGGGVSLVLDCRPPRLPRVLAWGPDLGALDTAALAGMAVAARRPVPPSSPDEATTLSILPEHGAGWLGTPGLRGHRAGRAWSPLLAVTRVARSDDETGQRLRIEAADEAAALRVTIDVTLDRFGLLHLQASVTNDHPTDDYQVDGLDIALPLPAAAGELLDLTGRWGRERSPQRAPVRLGCYLRESRRGRPGPDSSLVLAAGVPGFGFRSGRVWAAHVAWSGNYRLFVERLSSGETVLAGGELLLPGEIRVPPGQTYQGPPVLAAFGEGLDAVAHRYHDYLRARPSHPSTPRPVVLNTWEAVYFDHDLDRLTALADVAAEVGVERFVLDDGWFGSRRDDHAGLGDWTVSADVWPAGLHPLVDHVRRLGMQFGLWVEPEMINPDSDLARAHPDWILAPEGRLPMLSRFQYVLDLTNPDAWDHLRQRLLALLAAYPIDYLKWDHNRDVVDAGHGPGRRPAAHEQTLALYRLLDALRSAHPHLEIESCAGGGARVDLGILQRTDRVWASDCIDPLERQAIQRWTMQLLAPELVGTHIASTHSHTTGRRHDLAFRAGTALFGHLGIEWDLTATSPEERSELREWVALYKQARGWLHRGRVVRADQADPALWLHGVVAADQTQALYAAVAMATSDVAPPARVTLPGLDPDRRYRVAPQPPGHRVPGVTAAPVPWITDGFVELPGRVLGEVGVALPYQLPEHLLLLHARAVGPP
jgi:alpha-galactosidase